MYNNRFSFSLLMVCALIMTLLMPSVLLAQQHDHSQHQHQQPTEAVAYICPMQAQIVLDEPGTCPICGMYLVQRQAEQDSQVTVSGRMQQALGVRTHAVSVSTLWRYIETQGRVEWNTDAVSHVHPRAAGWIEHLAVKNLGAQVSKGDLLYTLYSQDMVVAQQDHLQTLDRIEGVSAERANALRRDGRRRLQLLGFTNEQIDALEQTRQVRYEVSFYAQQNGIVTELPIAEGMYIEPNTTVMTLAGRDALWLIVDVPERQSDWLALDTPVEIDLPQAGLDDFEARVDYIYPELDAVARTVRVRIILPPISYTERQKLLVGQQAEVNIFGGPKRDVLTIPASALIITGHENRVMVQTDDNTFVQRAVHVGLMVNDQVEILHGLEAGERVVSSRQFLLDSDASLQGNQLRNATDEPAADPHQHH